MKDIIIHCSASTFGNAATIDHWHRERGFNKIGYHFVILNGQIVKGEYKPIYDGVLETGRDLDEIGAHCKGYNENVGVCMIGDSGEFTIDQMTTLKRFVSDLRALGYGEVKQHSQYDSNKPYCAGLTTHTLKQLNQ